MTRSELVDNICRKYPSIHVNTINKTVDVIIEQIVEALKNRNRVEIRGFGSFSARKRAARQARNPKTNEKVSLPSRYAPYFRIGKVFHDRLNAK